MGKELTPWSFMGIGEVALFSIKATTGGERGPVPTGVDAAVRNM